MSRLFLRTLRDAPADAEVASHQLLVRGGYVRRVASGLWSWLPLGKIVLDRVANKYRDEARPRSGILRGRELLMKDAYSFDFDDAGLAKSYELHREAYVRIFDRLGLDYRIVSAVSGAMGGSASEEFLAPT